MILLSVHKKHRGALEVTHAHLDGTDESREPSKRMVRGCTPPIQIELSPCCDAVCEWCNDSVPLPLASAFKRQYVDPSTCFAKKQVLFTYVHIREHAVTVGEHDWCEGDIPLTLDWKHAKTRSIEIDDFEWIRKRQGRTPRGRLPKLDYHQRKQLLHRVAGITEKHLQDTRCLVADTKYLRLVNRSKIVTIFPSTK